VSGAEKKTVRIWIMVLTTAVALTTKGTTQTAQIGPVVRRMVSMEYPMLARMAGLQGTVNLRASVQPDGTAGEVTVLSGPEPLATPARKNVSRWRFDRCPSLSGSCVIDLVYSFTLDGACTDSPRCPTEFQVDLPNKVTVTSQIYGKPLP
jgi:hypothetical protein